MELSKQCCSIGLAKRLKELGVKQESFWYHIVWPTETPLYDIAFNPLQGLRTEEEEYINSVGNRVTGRIAKICSAYTVAELGEIMRYTTWHIASRPIGSEWGCSAPNEEGYGEHYADTEADARAKMLTHLLENKLITL